MLKSLRTIIYAAATCLLPSGAGGIAHAQVCTIPAAEHAFVGDIGAGFGTAVAGAGDVNNDGFADVIVGAPFDRLLGLEVGGASVYSGANGTVLNALHGTMLQSQFGASVAGAGDVNNDGFDDVIIGAPNHSSLIGNGLAVVYSGKTGTVLRAFTSPLSEERGLGNAVAGAGDIDLDGFGDVIAASESANSTNGEETGRVHVFSVRTGQELHLFPGDFTRDQFGHAVAGGGDADGDGVPDIAVGAPRQALGAPPLPGYVRIFSGSSGGLLHEFTGAFANDAFGRSLDFAGDVDGDQHADLIVSAPFGPSGGKALLYSGSDGSILRSFPTTGPTSDQFASAVAGMGDVDLDGTPDVVAGAPYASDFGNGSGRADVMSGADGALLDRYFGEKPGQRLGAAVDGAGDTDQDGRPDIVIGLPTSNPLVGIGSARVYLDDDHLLVKSSGPGCPGTGGFVPSLTAFGCPLPNEQLLLSLERGLGGATALLLIGEQKAWMPVGGGCILQVAMPFGIMGVTLGGVGPGAGSLTFNIVVPEGLAGQTATLQMFITDPIKPITGSATNALDILFG